MPTPRPTRAKAGAAVSSGQAGQLDDHPGRRTQNIENNPMHSSRWLPAARLRFFRNRLTRRANHVHCSTITQSVKRERTRRQGGAAGAHGQAGRNRAARLVRPCRSPHEWLRAPRPHAPTTASRPLHLAPPAELSRQLHEHARGDPHTNAIPSPPRRSIFSCAQAPVELGPPADITVGNTIPAEST